MLEISILSPLLQDFFFFNIVYQKISNIPLDAHTSAHIFQKQVISTANAVNSYSFYTAILSNLTRENSQAQDKKQRCKRSRRTICFVQKRICTETVIHSSSWHICIKGSYPVQEIWSKTTSLRKTLLCLKMYKNVSMILWRFYVFETEEVLVFHPQYLHTRD